MSPLSTRLFREPLVVGLAPGEVTLRGESIVCDPAFGAQPWQGALARLAELDLGRSRVSVELSNHFVRYALVPWSDALSTAAEEEVYVRHHFAKIHGERAKSWAVRATEAGPGKPRLASAVDVALINELKSTFANKPGTKLVSIQPCLMRRFNASRKALPQSGAWLVIAEEERACVALHGGKQWRSVQNAKGGWRSTLERERHRVEGAVPSLVFLAGAALPPGDAGWEFKEMPV